MGVRECCMNTESDKKRQTQALRPRMYFCSCDAISDSRLDFNSKAGAFVLPAAPPTTTRPAFYIYSPGRGEDADQGSCILTAEQHREGRRSVSAQPDGWLQISSAPHPLPPKLNALN